MRICYAGLMVDNPRHGFQLELEKVASGGYKELPTSTTNFQEELIRMVRDFRPDLLFIQTQSPAFTAQGVYELSELTFCMTFNGDIRHSLPAHYIGQERGFQLHTFSNMRDVREARANGLTADWLELGVEEQRFHPRHIPIPTTPIVAHLNHYENRFPLSQYRLDIVNRLRGEFPGQITVAGNFPGALHNFNTDQVMESKHYCGAKIAISCSNFREEKYSSDRLVRILASGCMALVDYYPAIEEMYTPGVHLETFKNLDELAEKCRYFLSNEAHRKQIADAGHEHVMNNYTYKHMCQNIKLLYEKYAKK